MRKKLTISIAGLVALGILVGCGLLDSEHGGNDTGDTRSADGLVPEPGETVRERMRVSSVPDESYRVKFSEKFDINGYVRDATGNPVPGVKIVKQGGDGGWTFTDERGHYLVGNNVGGLDYCLVPTMPACTFEPVERCFLHLDRNHVGQDFIATCEPRYDIDGYVRDISGNPMEGVKITKEGGDGGWTFTDETGYYLVGNNIPGLDYCLTPSKSGCAFDPGSRCYTDLDQDYHNQDFTITCE